MSKSEIRSQRVAKSPRDPAATPASRRVRANSKRTQAERSEDTQRKVLEAAGRLIARKGFAEFRYADVAVESGVSVGAQAHHFPTKDSLVLAVIEHVLAETWRQSLNRADTAGSREDVIRLIIEDAKEFFYSQNFLIAVNVLVSTLPPSALRESVLASVREYRQSVEESWRATMISVGYPKDLTTTLFSLTLAIVRGFAIRRLWQDDKASQDAAFALWEQAVVLILQAHETDALASVQAGSR